MAKLEKAKLQEVRADENQTPVDGTEVPVQFNPTSLKLKLTNQSDGGRSRGRQRRQDNGQSSTVLSMDLIFDTADEGTPDAPVSVRTRTREVERFVLPKKEGGEVPPLLRFEWDELIIIGLVESLDIDFDHFAENGAPLRAKVSLSIKEQEPKYTYAKVDKNAADASKPGEGNGATAPGSGTNEPGGKASDRSATALDDEMPAEFLARHGMDPAAWRGLDVDLSAGLGLTAGLEVGFSAGLSVSAGIGASFGVQADVGVSLEASLGINIDAGASVNVGASISGGASTLAGTAANGGKKVNGDAAGQVLSAAGGVQAAIATVKMQQVNSAVAATQSAFALAGTSSAINAGALSRTAASDMATIAVGSAATRAVSSGDAVARSDAAVSPTLKLPSIDSRATSYGFGVPLRPQYAPTLRQSTITLCSQASQALRADGGPAFAKQTTMAPWIALPQRAESRAVADTAEAKKRRHPCDYTYHPCHCDGD